MNTQEYEGLKISDSNKAKTLDHISIEIPIQININSSPLTITMCSPGDEHELVRGLLNSENVLRQKKYNPLILEVKNKNTPIVTYNVEVPVEELNENYNNSRTLLSVASCGICGKTELDDFENAEKITSELKINLVDIESFYQTMYTSQKGFSKSGGCHAASIFSKQGEMLTCKEDIGRHNAVDKVIGDLLLKESLKQGKTMLVSGRVSYEIIIKCFKANIPILAAVSAPSSLAIDFAKELGITLLGFCRDGRMTCYSNSYRIS